MDPAEQLQLQKNLQTMTDKSIALRKILYKQKNSKRKTPAQGISTDKTNICTYDHSNNLHPCPDCQLDYKGTNSDGTIQFAPLPQNPYQLIVKVHSLLRRRVNWNGIPIACQWELVQEELLLKISRLAVEEHHRIQKRTNPPMLF